MYGHVVIRSNRCKGTRIELPNLLSTYQKRHGERSETTTRLDLSGTQERLGYAGASTVESLLCTSRQLKWLVYI